MPTLAVAVGAGSVALWSDDAEFAEQTAALMAPLGTVSRLIDEDLMHVATAASGSAPAYLYAFTEALEEAAAREGLPRAEAARMVRATITGAAALLAAGGEDPAKLRKRVTSPDGTTAAALAVLLDADGVFPMMQRAVAAAVRRSRELGR
jgi:pyrroline-5-carboxylate reductase